MSAARSPGGIPMHVPQQTWEKIVVFAFGVIFVAAMLAMAIGFPHPTSFQYEVFRIVLAIACGGVAAIIPGFLAVSMDAKGLVIRAGGALAVFVLVYFFSPARLVTSQMIGNIRFVEDGKPVGPVPNAKIALPHFLGFEAESDKHGNFTLPLPDELRKPQEIELQITYEGETFYRTVPRSEVDNPRIEIPKTKDQGHLEPFTEGTFGILVLPFKVSSKEKKDQGVEVQSTISTTLSARFQELHIFDAEVRQAPASRISLPSEHAEARELGKTYHAALVMWGNITLAGIIPNLTIVHPLTEDVRIIMPDTILLKDTLTHAQLLNIQDIRLPSLTDEPTLFVSFITGLKHYHERQYEKAIQYFTTSLPTIPTKYIDSALIFYYRGNALLLAEKYDGAIADLNEVLELTPKNAKAYTNRGVAYYAKDDLNQAIADYTKALELDPKNVIAYFNRGNAYIAKDDLNQAIADFTKALELDPKNAKAYTNRGVAYYAKGEQNQAIADYTKALELDPKNAKAYTNRGVAYYAKDDLNQAIADFTKALELDPKNVIAYFNRGNAYIAKDDLNQAIADFTKALELDPKYVKAYTARGAIYRAKDDLNQAIADYTKALELDPKNAQAYYNRGIAYGAKGEQNQAIADYTKALELDPKVAVSYINRGVAYYVKDDLNQAIADFTKALELDPKNVIAYYNRGKAHDAKGEQNQAIADFTKALELDPRDADAYLNKAIIHEERGDIIEAVKTYTEFIRYASPKDAPRIDFAKQKIRYLKQHEHPKTPSNMNPE